MMCGGVCDGVCVMVCVLMMVSERARVKSKKCLGVEK